MRNIILGFLLLHQINHSFSQTTYFPQNTGNEWEATAPSTLNWCQPQIDSLYNYLEKENSKAFILLKNGKIVLEQYFNGHSQSANWYWASAGKTITSFMVGMAQQENYLNLTDQTSQYLGEGWTNCTPEQEQEISIWHQLTMTSGLNESPDPFCTIDTCLNYIADAGTRWSYHNGPYTLLDGVIESATGITLNQYTNQKLKTPTGMTGLFVPNGFNNVYFSNARSMARFGLLIQNNGNWNGNQIMTDTTYFNNMINTSQELNKSYGYLWWLSGKQSYMVPGLQVVIPGSLMKNAPEDTKMALGKDGQLLNVSTDENMVWIRMGESPDGAPVPYLMNDVIWEYINKLECNTTNTSSDVNSFPLKIYPNPFTNTIQIENSTGDENYLLINAIGQTIWSGKNIHQQDFSSIDKGIYFLQINSKNNVVTKKMMKE